MPGFSLASRPAERPVPLLTQSFKQAHGRVEKKKKRRKIDTATSQTDQSLDRGRRSDSKAPAASLLPLNYYYRQQGPIARGDRQSAPDKTMRNMHNIRTNTHGANAGKQPRCCAVADDLASFFLFCFFCAAVLMPPPSNRGLRPPCQPRSLSAHWGLPNAGNGASEKKKKR